MLCACNVCSHPDLVMIDSALLYGRGERSTISRHGMMMAERQHNGPSGEAPEALYDLTAKDLCRHLLVELRQWMVSNQGMLTHRHG
jgi:hypothetical protein